MPCDTGLSTYQIMLHVSHTTPYICLMSYMTPEGRDLEVALSIWPLESALLGPPQSSNLFPSP